MKYIPRHLEKGLSAQLKRGKSILLLGPRQTGKSTLLSRFFPDREISFLNAGVRQRYEKDPSVLSDEVKAIPTTSGRKKPLVVVDEVQKVPEIMDEVQALIDQEIAQFILTGSSARKLRRGRVVNLLPGRVITMRCDPFTYLEYGADLETLLVDGTLPGIVQVEKEGDRELELQSYVETYLEEEIRSEALVRNIGHFIRFLEYAGLESGKIINFHALSQEIGVNHTTIVNYFEILEDCLVAERIDPITKSRSRKKLTKSSRFLLFDLGVRRLCAGEGRKLGRERLGELFEQLVGLELIRYARLAAQRSKIRFWRDPDGPEIDWVIERDREWIPIEVKWTERPQERDIRHLQIFLSEYKEAKRGYVICRTPQPLQLAANIEAIPWQSLAKLLEGN